MSWHQLRDYQLDAINHMHNGCILCGDVGSGKSRTSLAYFYKECGGDLGAKEYQRLDDPKDLYIITTARKRDTFEWDKELTKFPTIKATVDSWNNIKKYSKVYGAFFIFDEQRVVGKGAWVKAFLKIAKKNKWILLSATPGDSWSDYAPVFIANGYFESRTDFMQQHAIVERYKGYPEIKGWIGEGYLCKLRRDILVTMNYRHDIVKHEERYVCEYDRKLYKETLQKRWDFFNDKPITNAAELCYILRRITNSDPSRTEILHDIFADRRRCIIFYNFDYERSILLDWCMRAKFIVKEWSGHQHEPVPKSDKWAYLVQYTAGAEGWNCITTNTVVFYSQNYSYKIMHQARGRIDRMNSPFLDLYYYTLVSRAPIDIAIERALTRKKNFNETRYFDGMFG